MGKKTLGRKIIFETCANCGDKIVDDEKALLIDEHNDLVFCKENCLREYFEPEVDKLEAEFTQLRGATDIPLAEFSKYENFLDLVLNEPDEIWEVETEDEEHPLSFYLGEFFHDDKPIFYVAAAYRVDDKPAFVYMHFPTNSSDLIEKYKRGELIYDEADDRVQEIDDEVTEGNIAIALYNEMLEHRSDQDIDPEDFAAYSDLKLSTVESPDEIWRQIDDTGNTFVIYLAHYEREGETVAYLVVAVEDDLTESAVPIFGFPTVDQKLLERFRQGELIFKGGQF